LATSTEEGFTVALISAECAAHGGRGQQQKGQFSFVHILGYWCLWMELGINIKRHFEWAWEAQSKYQNPANRCSGTELPCRD
jgi:hypothetical protein